MRIRNAAAVAVVSVLALGGCSSSPSDEQYNRSACIGLLGATGEFRLALATTAAQNGGTIPDALGYQIVSDDADLRQAIAERTPTAFGVEIANRVLETRMKLSDGTYLDGATESPTNSADVDPGSPYAVCSAFGIDLTGGTRDLD